MTTTGTIKKWLVSVGLGLCLWVGVVPAAAQEGELGTNRLSNASLESPYYGQGVASQTVPQGWNLWVGDGAPESLPDTTANHGQVAWLVRQRGVVFTAAGYQQVTVLPGDSVSASAWALVYTCNDPTTNCAVTTPPYHLSDATAGVELKIGIDPLGGIDPLAESVEWSALATAYDQWFELQVDAVAGGEMVTLFLYVTQAAGLIQNEVRWDNAVLSVTAHQPPTPTPTVTPSPTATATLTATPSPTATYTPSPTMTPVPLDEAAPELITVKGTVCFALFDDANADGARAGDEPLIDAEFNLTRPLVSATSYTTGSDERCLAVDAGDYEIEAMPPAGYTMTTSGKLFLTVSEGDAIHLSFGAAQGVISPTPQAVIIDQPELVDLAVADRIAPIVNPATSNDDRSWLDRIYGVSGWFFLGLAGLFAWLSVRYYMRARPPDA